METDSARWRSVSEPVHDGEREGLSYVRRHLPDRPPFLAWSNFTFAAPDGSLNEVDLLVLGPAGLYLVELKGWRRVSGNGQRWRAGSGGEVDNPLLLANRKAKRLRSMLERAARDHRPGLRIPWIQPAVFLHHADLVVDLDQWGRTGVYGLEPAQRQGGGLPGLVGELLTLAPDRAARLVDPRRAERLGELMDRLGYVPGKPDDPPPAAPAPATPAPVTPAPVTPTPITPAPITPTPRERTARNGLPGLAAWAPVPGPRVGSDLVAFSPDGRFLATNWPSGNGPWHITIVRAGDRTPVAVLEGHDRGADAMAFAPDGSRLVTVGQDGDILLWDTANWRPASRLHGHRDAVSSVAFSPDGRTLITGGHDCAARAWDTATWSPVADLDNDGHWAMAVAYRPDGLIVAVGGNDVSENLSVWRTGSWTRLAWLRGHRSWVRAVAFSPDGAELASGDDRGVIRLWDRPTWTARLIIEGHDDYIRALAFHPAGRLLASAGDDAAVRIWHAATGRQVAELTHDEDVESLAFSPDGTVLATAGDELRLFRVP